MTNITIVQGRLTADPELKFVGDNIPICEFTAAWSEKYKDTEKKLFLRCKAWRGTAELLGKYFAKGQELIVEGNLLTETWQDKETGKNKSRTVLNVIRVNFCGKKSDAPIRNSAPNGFEEISGSILDDDDIPF